jgi:hypothetical protein
MQDIRAHALQEWLNDIPTWSSGVLSALDGDASFRRYFRYQCDDGKAGIVMDAPPPQEDVRPFLVVQEALAQLSVDVPVCYAQDVQQGFLLLEDFGDQTLYQAVAVSDESRIDAYYRQALSQLAAWQSHPKCALQAQTLPVYDAALLVKEMQLLPDWLLKVHCDAPMSAFEQSDWHDWMRLLSGAAMTQPKTFVHRDYHSRNLMVTCDGRLGVIDFQDAVHGALTYDAVSLLKDAYLAYPEDQVKEWLRAYFLQLVAAQKLSQNEWPAFMRAFDWMGIQRHLKVLGIFARLYHRDGKAGYLKDMPLVLQYVLSAGRRYSELTPLANWLEKRLGDRLL